MLWLRSQLNIFPLGANSASCMRFPSCFCTHENFLSRHICQKKFLYIHICKRNCKHWKFELVQFLSMRLSDVLQSHVHYWPAPIPTYWTLYYCLENRWFLARPQQVPYFVRVRFRSVVLSVSLYLQAGTKYCQFYFWIDHMYTFLFGRFFSHAPHMCRQYD